MYHFITKNSSGTAYKRISKAAARKAFNAGKSVIMCPVKMRPFSFWHPEVWIDRYGGTFDGHVNAFTDYYCRPETGLYPAFYAAENEIAEYGISD